MLTKVARHPPAFRVWFLSLLLGGLAASSPAADVGDWSRVEKLGEGRAVIVTRIGGGLVNGHVAKVGADAIQVRTGPGLTDIPRSDVREVRKRRSRGLRAAQIGALGAGVGIGIAAGLLAATGGSDETAEIVLTGAAIGGALGGAAGAALPNGRLVYRKP